MAPLSVPAPIKNLGDYISRAVDPQDKTADSLIFFCFIGVGSLCFIQGWDTVINKAPLNPMNFGIGLGAILTGLGTGKWMRDGKGDA